MFLKIHLWCDTCQPLYGQYVGWSLFTRRMYNSLILVVDRIFTRWWAQTYYSGHFLENCLILKKLDRQKSALELNKILLRIRNNPFKPYPCRVNTCVQIVNSSVSAKAVITQLHNLFIVLVNMDIFQMTLILSLFIKPDTPINVYARFCLSTEKSKFSLVSPVAD